MTGDGIPPEMASLRERLRSFEFNQSTPVHRVSKAPTVLIGWEHTMPVTDPAIPAIRCPLRPGKRTFVGSPL